MLEAIGALLSAVSSNCSCIVWLDNLELQPRKSQSLDDSWPFGFEVNAAAGSLGPSESRRKYLVLGTCAGIRKCGLNVKSWYSFPALWRANEQRKSDEPRKRQI